MEVPYSLPAGRLPINPLSSFAFFAFFAVRSFSAEVFRSEVTPGSIFYSLLQRYTQALFNQVAQSAACNRLHSIEERFCRWMLMTQDRVASNEFPLTQEFLGQMLGVRRASISVTAAVLQKAGIIQYNRGKMRVIDRPQMENIACECYKVIKTEFDRLLNNSRKC